MVSSFFDKKPVIGMLHLMPLPGSPNYGGNMKEVVDAALFDLEALTRGGVDAFIIENFGDVPYAAKDEVANTVAMAAPAGPMRNTTKNKISKATFKKVEKIKKTNGVTESP